MIIPKLLSIITVSILFSSCFHTRDLIANKNFKFEITNEFDTNLEVYIETEIDSKKVVIGAICESKERIDCKWEIGKEEKEEINFINSDEVLIFRVLESSSPDGLAIGLKKKEYSIFKDASFESIIDKKSGKKYFQYRIRIHAIYGKILRNHVVGHVCPPNPNGPPGSC